MVAQLIGSLILKIANIRLELHNKSMEKEKNKIAVERERNTLLYIKPDNLGALPIPTESLPDLQNEILRKYDLIYAKPGSSGQSSAMVQASIPNPSMGGDFFNRWKNNKLPKDGKIWLGTNIENGEEYYEYLDDIRSALIGGIPGMGKSTFARLILAQILTQGGKFAIIDPHLDSGDDALGASFKAVEDKLVCPIGRDPAEQLRVIATVRSIINDRLSGRSVDKFPIIFATDETNQMLEDTTLYKELVSLLGLIVNQGRKARVYAISIGQNFHSRIMDTTVRNSYISIFSVCSRKEVAKLISGNTEFAEIAEKLTRGQVAYFKYGTGGTTVLNVPNVTANDLFMITFTMQKSAPKEIVAKHEWIDEPLPIEHDYRKETFRKPLPIDDNMEAVGSSLEVAGSGEKATSNDNREVGKIGKWTTSEVGRKVRIKEMLKNQIPFNEIVRSEWGVTGGNAYQSAARELRAIIAEIIS